jgi:hypothetical protein
MGIKSVAEECMRKMNSSLRGGYKLTCHLGITLEEGLVGTVEVVEWEKEDSKGVLVVGYLWMLMKKRS